MYSAIRAVLMAGFVRLAVGGFYFLPVPMVHLYRIGMGQTDDIGGNFCDHAKMLRTPVPGTY